MRIRKFCWVLTVLCIFGQIFCGCVGNTTVDEKVLRLHVRADSDAPQAQAVKAQVVAALGCYLQSELDGADSFDETVRRVERRCGALADIASAVLRKCGYGYGATAELTQAYFPEREYNGETVPAGTYDALIVRLGKGGGDNWWGMLYPYLSYAPSAQEELTYKSLIAEIVQRRF